MVVSPTAKDRNGTMVVTLNVSVKTLPLVSTDVIRSKEIFFEETNLHI